MEILIFITVSLLTFLWFLVVLYIGKVTVGVNASVWWILLFLLIAGPLGWACILIIIAYDWTDKLMERFKK
jgi:hypothetical protein